MTPARRYQHCRPADGPDDLPADLSWNSGLEFKADRRVVESWCRERESNPFTTRSNPPSELPEAARSGQVRPVEVDAKWTRQFGRSLFQRIWDAISLRALGHPITPQPVASGWELEGQSSRAPTRVTAITAVTGTVTPLVASGDAGGNVKLWRLLTGECLAEWRAHEAPVRDLAILRDRRGGLLVSVATVDGRHETASDSAGSWDHNRGLVARDPDLRGEVMMWDFAGHQMASMDPDAPARSVVRVLPEGVVVLTDIGLIHLALNV